MNERIAKAWRRFVFCSLLGLLLAFSLSVVPSIAQQPSTSNHDRAQTLNQQGQQQLEQGNPQAALESWQQAEALYRQIGNPTGAIGTQLNQAKALQALGFYRRAKTLLELVVTVQQQQPNSALKANGLLTLGNVLRLVGEYDLSQKNLAASLSIARQLNSSPDLQAAYLHLGNTLLAQQKTQDALDRFSQAAAIDGTLKLSAQLHQLKLLRQLKRPTEATHLLPQIESQLATSSVSQLTIYGQIELADILTQQKQEAVETQKYQDTPIPPSSHPTIPPSHHPTIPLSPHAPLKAAQLLTTAAQQAQTLGDRRAQSYAIGRLGALYEQTQQWNEAKRLTQEALQLARGMNVPEILYQWQWQTGRILQAQGHLPEATAAYTEAVNTLQSLRTDLVAIGQDVQFSFRDKVEPVYRELVDLLLQPQATQKNLSKARQVIESLQLAELNNFFREACLEAEARPLDTVDPTAAVLYPIILGDRLEVILSLPGQPLQHYATSLPKADIEAGIEQMQASLRITSFAQERLATARKMYDWLIKPAAPDLAKNGIKTLVFVLDGALRNLPMAALHDGDRYLIQQYQIALAPGLQLLSPRKLEREQIYALVGGLTEGVAGASPLPGVEQEVDQIRRQIPTQVLLNQSFTNKALTVQVQKIPFTVVHLATHGQFSSKIEDTYIQTWNQRLNVHDLQTLLKQRLRTNTDAIDLLVLSACETATGDNRATLGMAGVAVRSGAHSTLATLWTVNDASTATFIAEFYTALTQPGMSKAQAVQQAQSALIQSQAFKHPFYWAPFILVGNWL